MRTTLVSLGLAAVLAGAGVCSAAPQIDPAVAPVANLDDALLRAMKVDGAGGYKARYAVLKPVVKQSFDLPAMTQISVGDAWATLSPPQRAAMINAFERLTIASYAHNFDGWDGQRFVIDPNVNNRGGAKIVQTQLLPKKGSDAVSLSYRLHQTPAGWKVIDVYYNGTISQLTTRRSDFTATLNSQGAQALIDLINKQADKLAR